MNNWKSWDRKAWNFAIAMERLLKSSRFQDRFGPRTNITFLGRRLYRWSGKPEK